VYFLEDNFMITIITGKPGAGKTLFMTYKALEMLKRGFDVMLTGNWIFPTT